MPKKTNQRGSETDLYELAVMVDTKPTRGLGYLSDLPDERDYKAGALLGAAPVPDASDLLSHHVRGVRDQGSTSSCVGMAIATAIDTRLRKLGAVTPEPSALGIYTMARALSAPGLTDFGSYPRDAFRQIKDVGVVPEHVWPFDVRKVVGDSARLPWHVHQEASRFLCMRWWRVYEVGEGRSERVAAALSRGLPVVFGYQTDETFVGYQGGVIDQTGTKNRGGHMLTLLSYRTEGGSRIFGGINSWGTGWGRSGFYEMHDSVFGGPRVSDVYVVEVAP